MGLKGHRAMGACITNKYFLWHALLPHKTPYKSFFATRIFNSYTITIQTTKDVYILNKHIKWHTLLPPNISRLIPFHIKKAIYYVFCPSNMGRTRDIDPGFTRLMMFFQVHSRLPSHPIVRPDDKQQIQ